MKVSRSGMNNSRIICLALALAILALPATLSAQTGAGSLRMAGHVSATVALAARATPLSATGDQARFNLTQPDISSLSISLAGATRASAIVRVPVLVRSNVAFALTATARAAGAEITAITVEDARATGAFVFPEALARLRHHAATGAASGAIIVNNENRLPALPDQSLVTLLSGPRISRAGTLHSPHNALELIIALTIKPRADSSSWQAELRFFATPDNLAP